jgi:two-component system sensor histidine kinase/response regulator
MDALGYIRRYLEIQGEHASEQLRGTDAAAHAPLREVLDWLVTRYGLQLESRGQLLQMRDITVDGVVAIDPLVLRQVAENLLSNAMKYAPASVVELSIRQGAPGYWQLLVEDRGPGIPASKQRQLFKPFVRLSEVDPADGLSSGLGLSLAKQIIEKNGGQLWYEDREGGGARFVIELPMAAAAPLTSTSQTATTAVV